MIRFSPRTHLSNFEIMFDVRDGKCRLKEFLDGTLLDRINALKRKDMEPVGYSSEL